VRGKDLPDLVNTNSYSDSDDDEPPRRPKGRRDPRLIVVCSRPQHPREQGRPRRSRRWSPSAPVEAEEAVEMLYSRLEASSSARGSNGAATAPFAAERQRGAACSVVMEGMDFDDPLHWFW